MAGLIVRTSGDAGSGFRLDPDRSSPDIPDDVAREFSDLQVLYAQLAHVGTGPALAVVTARYSHRLQRWVGVLQGSGGFYGAAGTVQFVTTTAPAGLSDVLPLLLAAQEEGYLHPGPIGVGGSERLGARSLVTPVANLLRVEPRRRVVIIDGERPDALRSLADLAVFLPETVARRYTWSSGLAVTRIEREEYVVTLEWPEELRERHPDSHRPMTLMAMEPVNASARDLPIGMRWALSQANGGTLVGRTSDAPDLARWMQDLEADRPLTGTDVRELLYRPLGESEAHRWRRDNISQSVLASSPALLETLLGHPSVVVREDTAALLISREIYPTLVKLEHARAKAGRGPLTPVGQVDHEFCLKLARDVTDRWSYNSLLAARPWLTGLGLNRKNAEPFFPLGPGEIEARLIKDPSSADEAVTFANQQKNPQAVLLSISGNDPGACGAVAAALVSALSPMAVPYILASRERLERTRGLHGVLKGASAYLSRTGGATNSAATRSDLVMAYVEANREVDPPRIGRSWDEKHAIMLMTFASSVDYSQAMVVVTRRRASRRVLSALVVVVAVIGATFLKGLLPW